MTLSEILSHPATIPTAFSSSVAIITVLVNAYVSRRSAANASADKTEDRQASIRKGDLELIMGSERVFRESLTKELTASKDNLSKAEKAYNDCQRSGIRLESKYYQLKSAYKVLQMACAHAHEEIKKWNKDYIPPEMPALEPDND